MERIETKADITVPLPDYQPDDALSKALAERDHARALAYTFFKVLRYAQVNVTLKNLPEWLKNGPKETTD